MIQGLLDGWCGVFQAVDALLICVGSGVAHWQTLDLFGVYLLWF
jgi:hypothetical protein